MPPRRTPATHNIAVYNANGELFALHVLDYAEQESDPAIAPPGTTKVRIPRVEYDGHNHATLLASAHAAATAAGVADPRLPIPVESLTRRIAAALAERAAAVVSRDAALENLPDQAAADEIAALDDVIAKLDMNIAAWQAELDRA